LTLQETVLLYQDAVVLVDVDIWYEKYVYFSCVNLYYVNDVGKLCIIKLIISILRKCSLFLLNWHLSLNLKFIIMKQRIEFGLGMIIFQNTANYIAINS
jgi:hypothetical protein